MHSVSKHTPGPWKTIPSPHGRKYRCVQFGTDETYTSLEMLPADARLVAAAPDLLAALRELLPRGWRDGTMDHMQGVKLARKALDKASGKGSLP